MEATERLALCLLLAFLLVSALSARFPGETLSVAGSTGVLPAAIGAERAMGTEGRHVHLIAGGSLFGLDLVRRGEVTLALSEVRPGEGLWSAKIGTVPVLVVAHPGTGVRNLSEAELRAVLVGGVTDWAQLGGRPLPLTLIFRTAPSGLRLSLTDLLLGRGAVMTARSVNALSNGDVAQGILHTPGTIGFLEGDRAPGGLEQMTVGGRRAGERGYPLVLSVYVASRTPPDPKARRFIMLVGRYLRR